MKLQPDKSDVQSISGYGPGWVGVDAEKITHSVILSSRGERIAWPAERFEDLGAEHFELLAQVEAEVIIFGSGSRIRFPQAGMAQAAHGQAHRHRDHGHGRGLPHLQHPGSGRAQRGSSPSA